MLQDFRKKAASPALTSSLFLPPLYLFSPSFLFLIFWADRGDQFLAQPPQPVLCGEPENFGRRQGHKARGRHSTEVAGECGCQRSSRGGIKSPAGFGRDDGRTGLFLSRRLIFFKIIIWSHIHGDMNKDWEAGGWGGCATLWFLFLCIWCVWY